MIQKWEGGMQFIEGRLGNGADLIKNKSRAYKYDITRSRTLTRMVCSLN